MQHTQAMTDMANEAEIAVNVRVENKKRWLIMAGVAMMVISFLIVWFSTPYYSAESRILIEDWGNVRTSASSASGQISLEDVALQDQLGIISSAHLLRSAGAANETGLLAALRKNLKISKAENSRIISIQYLATDPVQAVRFTNALADSYVQLLRHEAVQAESVNFLPASARVLSRSNQTQTIVPWWIWPSVALGFFSMMTAILAYVMPNLLAGYKEQAVADIEIEPITTLIMPVLLNEADTKIIEEMLDGMSLPLIDIDEPAIESVPAPVPEPRIYIEQVWKEARLAA